MISALSPWPALLLTLIALFTALLLCRLEPDQAEPGRHRAIDGIRGYLAFFVFLHHTTVWYGYVRTGTWRLPDSHLYVHLGQSSVALFFMITGFLFWSKMLAARGSPVDWVRLYASRIMRLTPLHVFVVLLLLLVVAFESGFQLREPITTVALQVLRWLTFTISGTPDVNALPSTYTINAGVTWSLRYEWLFYLALPLLAVALRVRAPLPLLAFSGLCVLACLFLPVKPIHLAAFIGGILAAHWQRAARLLEAARHPLSSLLAIACLILAVVTFRGAENFGTLLLLTVVFLAVSAGNTLFGLLDCRPARLLGDISYSIYLLHGIVLFVTYRMVLGPETSLQLSPLEHWLVGAILTPVLVASAYLTYRFVERPGIRATQTATAFAKGLLGSR